MKLCPSLHALYIGVDTSHPQASFTKVLEALPAAVQPESAFQFLALGCCEPVGHLPTVASCLAMTFKNLRAFVGGHPYAEESDDDDEPSSLESWEEVEEHLPLCDRKSESTLRRWWLSRRTGEATGTDVQARVAGRRLSEQWAGVSVLELRSGGKSDDSCQNVPQ